MSTAQVLAQPVAVVVAVATRRSSTSFRRGCRQHAALRRQRPSIRAAAAAAEAERTAVPVTFVLGGAEVTVDATPGQNLWEVAKDAGADITLGCSQGSCGVCEVEVYKYSSSGGSEPSVGVVRACIAGVPPGYERLEVREVPLDDIWGVDGYDT